MPQVRGKGGKFTKGASSLKVKVSKTVEVSPDAEVQPSTNPTVSIFVPLQGHLSEPTHEVVTINGIKTEVVKGEETQVPENVAEVLSQAYGKNLRVL